MTTVTVRETTKYRILSSTSSLEVRAHCGTHPAPTPYEAAPLQLSTDTTLLYPLPLICVSWEPSKRVLTLEGPTYRVISSIPQHHMDTPLAPSNPPSRHPSFLFLFPLFSGVYEPRIPCANPWTAAPRDVLDGSPVPTIPQPTSSWLPRRVLNGKKQGCTSTM